MLIYLILFLLVPLCGLIGFVVAIVKDHYSSHGRHLHGDHF
jgi:hypothetical protein